MYLREKFILPPKEYFSKLVVQYFLSNLEGKSMWFLVVLSQVQNTEIE